MSKTVEEIEQDQQAAYETITQDSWHQNFKGQDLTGQDFSGQDLTGSNFVGANVTGCNFDGAILQYANLKDMIYDATTSWNGAQINQSPWLPYIPAIAAVADNVTRPPADVSAEYYQEQIDIVESGETISGLTEEDRNTLMTEILTQANTGLGNLTGADQDVVNEFVRIGIVGTMTGTTYSDVATGRDIYNSVADLNAPAKLDEVINKHLIAETYFDVAAGLFKLYVA